MKQSAGDLSLSAVRAKRSSHAPTSLRDDAAFTPRTKSHPPKPQTTTKDVEVRPGPRIFCDPWRILAALKQNSRWLFTVAGVTAFGTGFFGYLQSSYKVRVTLIPREANTALAFNSQNEAYRPRQLTPATLVSLLQTSDLLRRAAMNTQPSISAQDLEGRLTVTQVAGTDLAALTVTGKHRQSLVDLANLVANQAVAVSRELQATDARQMSQFCRNKLTALDEQLNQANNELIRFQNSEKLADPDAEKQGYLKQLSEVMARTDNTRIDVELMDLQLATLQNEVTQQNPVTQKLASARNQLSELLSRYTQKHPMVQRQHTLIAELENQLPAAADSTLSAAKYSDNPQVSAMYTRVVDLRTRKATATKELSELTKLRNALLGKVTGLSEKGLRYATLKAQFDGLQKSQALLVNREREAQLYADNSQGYYRVFTPAKLEDVDSLSRWLAALVAGSVGLLLGGLGAGLVIAGREIADRRLKTTVDLQRATGLPVLASLGDLNQMSTTEKDAWAFRTWTAISGQLNASPNHGIVCGFISSDAGEGRSTWIELLVGAAKRRGLQVMTIATQTEEDNSPARELPANVVEPDFRRTGVATVARLATAPSHQTELPFSQSLTVEPTPAFEPSLPLLKNVWDRARRKEWQNALARMRRMDNLVLLVELPPASVPEAVLLAESLPQIIWLADSGRADGRDTREQLQTLRHAKCRLVGAVLNHQPKPVFEL